MVGNTYYTYDTPLGEIVIVSDGEAITELKTASSRDPICEKKAGALTDRAAKQLEEYCYGKLRQFDVPLNPYGTHFQLLVWRTLQEIPYGETKSYKQIAGMIGNPKAYRAVGLANNRNPIWIMIPCHRVIGSDGSLIGYGGGLEMKRKLIELEKMSR